MDRSFDQDNHYEMTVLLLGHKVVAVSKESGERGSEGYLVLDNGYRLDVIPNRGCAGCESGWYELSELNECDNIITKVEFVTKETSKGCQEDLVYDIYVYAENKRINLLSVEGTDGNGYYGTGYKIRVRSFT